MDSCTLPPSCALLFPENCLSQREKAIDGEVLPECDRSKHNIGELSQALPKEAQDLATRGFEDPGSTTIVAKSLQKR